MFRDCGPVLSSPLIRVVEAQIAMDRLPHSRSIYATPGRKSYGQRGVLPSEADPFAGLVQATWALTEWGEHVTLPAFGFLTVKANGSQKAVTSLVFATDLFHPEDQPDLEDDLEERERKFRKYGV